MGADVQRAFDEQQLFQAKLERRSTEATVIYLLATNRMNHRALMLEDEQRFSRQCRTDGTPAG